MDLLASFLILLQRSAPLQFERPQTWTYFEGVDGSHWQAVETTGPRLTPLDLTAVPVITAQAAAVQDTASGQVLWAKEVNLPRPLASVAKLMTALVVLGQNPDWDQLVMVTAADRRPAGGNDWLRLGERYTLRQLWQASLVASLNSATAALVRSVGLDDAQYRQQAKEIAQQLGLAAAVFTDPTGLDQGTRASAADVLCLLAAAAAEPEIEQTAKQSGVSLPIGGKGRWFPATDELIAAGYGIKAGKTGYTEEAGYNLAVQLRREGKPSLRVVVLGSRSSAKRFSDVQALAEWALEHYQW